MYVSVVERERELPSASMRARAPPVPVLSTCGAPASLSPGAQESSRAAVLLSEF